MSTPTKPLSLRELEQRVKEARSIIERDRSFRLATDRAEFFLDAIDTLVRAVRKLGAEVDGSNVMAANGESMLGPAACEIMERCGITDEQETK